MLWIAIGATGHAAKQDAANCPSALTWGQKFRRTTLSWNFASNVAFGDRDAMAELVSHGFIAAGSIRYENYRSIKKDLLLSLLRKMDQGFLYDIDGLFAARLLPVERQRGVQGSSQRIYIRLRNNLYSAQIAEDHPRLEAFRSFMDERAQNIALSNALSHSAFRYSAVVVASAPETDDQKSSELKSVVQTPSALSSLGYVTNSHYLVGKSGLKKPGVQYYVGEGSEVEILSDNRETTDSYPDAVKVRVIHNTDTGVLAVPAGTEGWLIRGYVERTGVTE